MSLEVEAQPGRESRAAESGAQLLEHRTTLAVGDAVEVQEGLVGVSDRACDRMRCWRIVFDQRPALQLHVELLPGGGVLGPFGQAEGGGICGERFVEPEVIPPAHRDQVAEPHVGDLVEDDLGKVGHVAWCWRAQEDVALGVADEAHILHCTDIEFWAVDMVKLLKRILTTEEFAVVNKGLTGHLLEEVVREILL